MRWFPGTAVLTMLMVSSACGDSIFDTRGTGKDVIQIAGGGRALAGAVAASSNPLNSTVMSPFASALADRVTLTAGFSHLNTRTDNLGEKKRTLVTLFPTVVAIVPYKRVSFMTGLFLEKEGRLTSALTDSAYGGVYDLRYRRETSIHTVPIFISSSLHRRVLVSAGVLLSAFNTRETYELDFPSDDRVDTRDASDVSARGHAFAAGLMVDFDFVSAAGLFRTKTDLDGAVDRESRYAGVWDSEDVSFTSDESFKLGLRITPHRYFAIEADYEKSPWSGLRIDDRRIGGNDVYRWAVGVEYRGRIPWDAQRFPLLAGYYRQPLDWRSAATGEIVEEVFSIGTSIPLAKDRAAVSLAVEVGRREAENNSDLSETIYGLSLSVSAIEAWRREVRAGP
jgi:hypothetical protein